MASKRVLSVGQCGADHAAIAGLLRELDAEVVPADSAEEALALLRGGEYDLVLANRVFDRGGSGLDFITRLKDGDFKDVPVMLVSNYEDAQQQATARGALLGFGKAALDEPATHRRLAEVLRGE
jgi:CheY-like chemotaxis protein